MAATETPRYPHAAYRASRQLVPSPAVDESAILTVFVGLYNGAEWLDGLLAQIEAQEIASARWVFVDNASADDSWERVSAWAATTTLDVTLVRNAFNLGGTGSIFVNLDLITTDWLAFMHQDDIYLPNHFSTLANAAAGATDDTVGIFSEMGRVNQDGKRIGAYPPASWMVPDLDPATVFLGLVRNHFIPWPTIAFRTAPFGAAESPWHSTAFPDTEVTLKLAARGRFVHLPVETMRYRDNPGSESRVIDGRERQFGATLSLTRTFQTPEFEIIARGVVPAEREAFALALKDAILVRLGESDRATLVVAGAFERLIQFWDRTEPRVLAELRNLYDGIGAAATSSLLDRMTTAAGGSSLAAFPEPVEGSPAPAGDAVVADRGAAVRLWERVGYLVPRFVRRPLSTGAIRVMTRGHERSAWRYEWR